MVDFDLYQLNHVGSGYESILTHGALVFLRELNKEFGDRIDFWVQRREQRKRQLPHFLNRSKHIRDSEWKCAPIPAEIQYRRVEITGPTTRKMIINALNSGSDVYMADFEDSNCPTKENNLQGQINLRDAVNRNIDFVDEVSGKEYKLKDKTAVLMVRPRGLHLKEKIGSTGFIHGCLFDFGLYFYHNVASLLHRGSRPYFYIPKIEHYQEARLWADIFAFAENYVQVKHGTIRATMLIETLPAVFQMNEILYELRDYAAGLNCGRWDYIFSFIKTTQHMPGMVLPDRNTVGMDRLFLEAYSKLLIETCHKRGVYAMGGMAAQIPIKGDPEANEKAMNKVISDKDREVKNGHDGTWVAHPGLAATAMDAFRFWSPDNLDKHTSDTHMDPRRRELLITNDLMSVPDGDITEEGLRVNVSVGIQYMAAWLSGNGCVAINNLMEDAATAEISRAQIWQWLKYDKFTTDQFMLIVDEEMDKIKDKVGAHTFQNGKYQEAAEMFTSMSMKSEFDDFLTIPAYQKLTQ